MKSITITEETVMGWRIEIEKCENRIAELRRMVEFFDQAASDQATITEHRTTRNPFRGSGYGSKSALILGILQEKSRYVAPLEIKEIMKQRGVSENEWGKKYVKVHGALARLLKAGKIKKSPSGNKYRAGALID